MLHRNAFVSGLVGFLCLFMGVVLFIIVSGGEASSRQRSNVEQSVVLLPVADEPETPVGGLEAAPVDFAREVLPILSNHCYACHGPDQDSAVAKKAGFRLDIREEAVDFEMIVPGDPGASPVIEVLETTKASRRMPPLDSGKPQLKPEQVDVLKRWIKQGAEYADHWSFVKLSKPAVPATPAGADPGWASNDLDRFIQAKLLDNGLVPNAKADPHRLIRRLYLDLIGLPPTPEQAKAFVQDPSPQAYAQIVDELLSSPKFGEHWARQWLDKARYADTQGFAEDRPRSIWRFRDYVIDAYNRDLPFDQFTIEQIAGDLLPDPTLDQLIATGFHRNTMTNTEGGTDDEEFRAAAVIDRVNTTGEVWLGLTLACVQCHTHKYDPIFHDEYFALYAFFNQTEDSDKPRDIPFIKAPTPEHPDATTLVMKELPADQRRETYLFKGGSFLAPDKEGGIVEPGIIKALHPFPKDAPKNRLGLAQWLVHEDNPLTARVQANRIWEQIWGIGLVETTEDFGFQGSYPSNKPLLDYLAYTYQFDLKWSTKSLIRMIVMSSAYQQSALHTAEKMEIDPLNRLMSRGPRMRLSAEQIRDQALAIAGILNTDRIGGPSVTPYLPDGILAQSFSGVKQQESKGADLYRRGVYTYWQRTAHYASFAAFDAPSRDVCTAKRSRTNTPLQVFVTLNDRVYVEAAQMLGRRLIQQAGDDIDARLNLGVWLALQRDATQLELTTLREVYTQALADYRENPEAAGQMAAGPAPALPETMDVADAAAMTLVGNVLLNLDELINKP